MSKKLFDVNALKTKRFEIQNKAADKVEMILYGAVGDQYDGVSAKQFSDALSALPPSVKEIHLRINSPGGSVFEGNTIYERLKTHKAKVIVYVDGLAASIASLIAMAGDEIHVGEGSFFMVHRPWTFAIGNSSDLERQASLLDKLGESMMAIYSKKTGMSKSEIEKNMQEDWWLNSEESVAAGFATHKTSESETLHMAASYIKDSAWLKKGLAPTIDASNKLVKTKKAELLAEIENFQARKKS